MKVLVWTLIHMTMSLEKGEIQAEARMHTKYLMKMKTEIDPTEAKECQRLLGCQTLGCRRQAWNSLLLRSQKELTLPTPCSETSSLQLTLFKTQVMVL